VADKTSKRPRITTKCPDCGRKLTLRPGKPFEYRGKGEHRRTYTRARCVRCGMNAWLFPDGEIGMISYNRPISVKLVRGKKTSKAGRKSSKTSARKTSAKKTSKKLIAARKRVSKADSSLKKAKSRAKRLVASRKTAAGKAKARKTSKKKVAFFEKRLARAKAAAKAAKQ
jgi:hypothetical protein